MALTSLPQLAMALGDDLLILGHRLSEWCGHGPMLEEDIALANIALDCLGQSEYWLRLAGTLEQNDRTEDTLAFFRDETEFRNLLLVEQPNGDFAVTMLRQLFISLYYTHFYQRLLQSSEPAFVQGAEKGLREIQYHLRHARSWVVRLGDGTEESHRRLTTALTLLWPLTAELFDPPDPSLFAALGTNPWDGLHSAWRSELERTLREATISLPEAAPPLLYSGRQGQHSEHLGHLLAVLQSTARAHPQGTW